MKAIGVEAARVRDSVQNSMNLTNHEGTPLHRRLPQCGEAGNSRVEVA